MKDVISFACPGFIFFVSFDLRLNTEKLSFGRGGVCGMIIFSGIEGSSASLLSLHFVALPVSAQIDGMGMTWSSSKRQPSCWCITYDLGRGSYSQLSNYIRYLAAACADVKCGVGSRAKNITMNCPVGGIW